MGWELTPSESPLQSSRQQPHITVLNPLGKPLSFPHLLGALQQRTKWLRAHRNGFNDDRRQREFSPHRNDLHTHWTHAGRNSRTPSNSRTLHSPCAVVVDDRQRKRDCVSVYSHSLISPPAQLPAASPTSLHLVVPAVTLPPRKVTGFHLLPSDGMMMSGCSRKLRLLLTLRATRFQR